MLHRNLILLFILFLALSCKGEDDDANNDDSATQIEICDSTTVQVSSVQVLCDSPRTYYYGNGANRNSVTCDYGDKATVSVTFDTVQDLDEDEDIYMVMAIYSQNGERLYAGNSNELCQNMVGSTCAYQGSYSFSNKVSLANTGGYDAQFGVVVEMAFSREADGGSSLGGVNIGDCDSSRVGWYNGQQRKRGNGGILADYCIFAVTIAMVSSFFWILATKDDNEGIEIKKPADGGDGFELMEN